MHEQVSRRRVLQRTAAVSGTLIVGFSPQTRSWVVEGQSQPRQLDGSLVYDDASRENFSIDMGNHVQHLPRAVLKAGSIEDVVKMVQYANRHDLKIAMRGQGHSRYGQSLVEGGIVVDSRGLNAVDLVNAGSVDAQPGALWGKVAQVTFARGLTPKMMPDGMMLSVGGVLSAGGLGRGGRHYVAVVEHVEELEVVTGDGRRVTCSPVREKELFEMVLAGLGQCALIVRARIGLRPAPDQLVRQTLIYDDLDTYMSDAKRLLLDGRFDHQSLLVQRTDDGWSFEISIGQFYSGPEAPDLSGLQAGLRFGSRLEPTRTSYWDYAHGEAIDTAFSTMARSRSRDGALVVFIPESAARDFLEEVLATLSESDFGLTSFNFPPMDVRQHTRPLLKLPGEDLAFGFWLYPRSVEVDDKAGYRDLMESNNALLEHMRSVDGKGYPPFAPHSNISQWKQHYGPAT